MPPSSAIRPLHPDTRNLVCDIANSFAISGTFDSAELIESGHINTTYRVSFREKDQTIRRYIIQSINAHVFRNPHQVMDNVKMVTKHINDRVLRLRKDLGGQTLYLFPARNGRFRVEDEQGTVWRCYNCIEGCVTYDVVENTRQAFEAARAFGAFQDLVSDLDASAIHETIPDFHNTPLRLQRLMAVAAADPMGRLASVAEEMDFVLSHEGIASLLLDHAQAGRIPIRVTHNDTKINNVMIDAQTDEAVCVIDLDTVMPGLSLYDFGDLVRSATSPAAEDEKNLGLVQMRMPIFEALVEGYLSTAEGFLNQVEIDHLAHSGKLMTLEVGIRFLTDYLEGDVYFKTKRPDHNLDRCRTQLRLVRHIEEQQAAMESFVRKVSRKRR
jgi:aminoglycoside phosphotransferase (APT) family kinase protein